MSLSPKSGRDHGSSNRLRPDRRGAQPERLGELHPTLVASERDFCALTVMHESVERVPIAVDVVVADHHRVVAEGVAALLTPHVRSVVLVYSAVALLERVGPGMLVVGDINLPDMPGLEPVRRIAERRNGSRFIVLSGHDEPLIVQDAM